MDFENIKTNKVGTIGSIILFIIVISLGYYFLFYNKKSNDEATNKDNLNSSKEIYNVKKINDNEDYIYFKDIEVVSEHLEINYQTPVINIDNESIIALNTKLKAHVDEIKNSVKKDSSAGVVCDENEENIVFAALQTNEILEYKNYLSLVLYDMNYTCPETGDYQRPSSYTIDLNTGKIVSYAELLAKFNTSAKEINNLIRNYLINSQKEMALQDSTLADLIKIDETLASFEVNENFAAYIDKRGQLAINYVVITTSINYNEIMIIDN